MITKKKYSGLPKDPRNDLHKTQHVNEPTYFYLKNLLNRFDFNGKIVTETGYLKTGAGIKTKAYNFLTTLHPVSQIFPLNLFFTWTFICVMKNNKLSE